MALKRTLSLKHLFASEETDDRGLVPLAEARARVAAARVFRVGAWSQKGDIHYTEGDRLWAALLSLETAEEFAAHVMRIAWEVHPRGWHRNTDPFDVFGDDAIVLAEAATDADGDLRDVCSNVRTCALLVGTPRARALVERVRSVDGDTRAAQHFRRDWIRRHGTRDERVPSPLSAADILRELDAAQERAENFELTWPFFGSWDHSTCHHITRLVAAVRPETAEWCVLLDQLTGADASDLSGDAWEYGTVPIVGWNEARALGPSLTIEPEDARPDEIVILNGPAGSLEVGPADIADPLLRPEEVDIDDVAETARVRVYLRHLGASALPPADVRVRAALGDGPYVLVACTERFRHEADIAPSEQATYRSLAEALANADPSRFIPGESNTHFEDPERRGPEA